MTRTLIGILICLTAALGCDDQPEIDLTQRDAAPAEIELPMSPSDAKMRQAHARAQDELPRFIEAFQNPKPMQLNFSIKARFDQDGLEEQLWFTPTSYDDNVFNGTIDTDPLYLTNLEENQAVAVPVEQITDWMYVEEGALVGGYTIRVLRSRLSPAELAEFDKTMGFRVD